MTFEKVQEVIAEQLSIGKEIPDDAVVNFSTVGDIVNFIDGVM